MQINKNRKFKFYLVSHEDAQPYLIFIIKFHKDNIYFIDHPKFIEKFEPKISYHAPRTPGNKSQVHLKINDTKVNAHLCCPANEIKGVRYLGGSGIPLDSLKDLQIFEKNKENEEYFIFDSREIRLSHLSSIQWSYFLVEPNQEDLFYKHPMIDKKEITEASERIHIEFIKETNPWVVIEFIRIRDESPIWYK